MKILAACVSIWVTLITVGQVTTEAYNHYLHDTPLAFSGEITRCGSYLNNSHGYIKTPNFPREFPLPISCQWLLQAPPGKKIVLYFTQYYMRQSLHLIEYDYYESVHKNRGRHDLGEVSFEVSSYTVYKPYLLLRFEVEEADNIHLRVHQFLLDVYGFNITYEMVDDHDDLRPDDCFKHKCSFLGNCLVNRDFSKYQCHCFSGYFGEECQYGPFCDPAKGINMCKNGGKCRYFYGSLVNTCECPPGFEGVQCETKKEGYNVSDSHCDSLDCEQKCVENEGDYHCECEEGFRLATDKKTCREKGRMRYFAQVRFQPDKHESENQSLCAEFQAEFLSKVRQVMDFVGVQFIEKVSISNISLNDGYWYVDFVFMGDKSENRNIWFLVDIVVANTTICKTFVADKTYIMRDAKPALHSMTLKNHDNKPLRVGDILTLVCEVKGSSNLKFEWYKDGSPINVSVTNRNMYIMNIPKANPETRMSVLDIDKASKLDAGVFTCKATDWNETKERNLSVEMLKPPQVEVKPLSKAVMPTEEAVFLCLSTEDKRGTFQYTWYLGDQKIQQSAGDNNELVEDLLPAGSRLTIRKAHKTRSYKCVVESESGQAEDKVTLMVVQDLNNSYFCTEEVYNGIMWPQTICGSSTIQKCYLRGYAQASRFCECVEDEGRWAIADMTGCTSIKLEAIKDQVDSLQLGYVSNTTGRLLEELRKFLMTQDTAKPMMGDLQLACHLLTRLQDHARKYYAIEASPASFNDILNIANILMERMQVSNRVEKKGNLGICIFRLMELLRKDRRMQEYITTELPSQHFKTRMLDVKIQYIGSGEMRILSDNMITVILDQTEPSATSKRKQRSIKPVIRRKFNGSMIAVTYKDISNFVFTEDLRNLQMELNSVALSTGPIWNNAEVDLDNDLYAPSVLITFHHLKALNRVSENASYCLQWISKGSTDGSWSGDGCQVIAVQKDSTSCRCQTPGHFIAVRSLHLDIQSLEPPRSQRFDVTLYGSVICLICCLATLFIRLIIWSQSQPVIRTIIINLCCAFILLNTTVIVGFHISSHVIFCRWILLLLVFSFLASMSFLLMEAVYLFTVNVKRFLNLTATTFTLVGWGSSLLVFVIFTIVTHAVDKEESDFAFCWLAYGRWDFITFISIASIYFLINGGLLLVLVRDAHKKSKEETPNSHQKYKFYLIRSGLLMLLLAASCTTSLIVMNIDTIATRYIFSSSMAMLGVIFLIFHGIIYIKKCSIVIGECQKECLEVISMRDQVSRQNSGPSDSIKTISNCESTMSAKLPIGGLVVSADEDPDDPYVRDRKYTKERREHLKSLLGTGSAETECIVRGSNSGSRSNSVTRSTIVTLGSGDGDEASLSSLSGPKLRHVANPKCACEKCGTALPYKPARGRAYILDQPIQDGPDEPLLAEKDVSSNSKGSPADFKGPSKTAKHAGVSPKSTATKDCGSKSKNHNIPYSVVDDGLK